MNSEDSGACSDTAIILALKKERQNKSIIKYIALSLTFHLTVICLFLLPSPARAMTFDLGLSVSQPSLKIKSPTNDYTLAEMIGQSSIWPSITIKTKEQYIGESNFGYTIEAMAWFMELDRQKVDEKEIDFGTSVKGHFAYLTPTIYYRFGDRDSINSTDWIGTAGIGLGLGYLKIRGSVLTTGTNPRRLENVDEDGFGASSGIFLEVLKNRWFFRVTSFGPVLNNDAFSFQLSDTSIKFGKRFDFDLF